MKRNGGLYIRNIVFGITDSLVSTVGLLSGIGVGGTAQDTIILTGVVYAFVEAFSMAVGSFLSEQSASEYRVHREISSWLPFVAGTVMFLSFILASFIPILPYMLVDGVHALWISVGGSIVALFIMGSISARYAGVSVLRHSIRMSVLGGSAIIIGVLVGHFVKA